MPSRQAGRCWFEAAAHALADVPVAEQELAAEVALLDDVVVGDRHAPAAGGGHAHARQVLDKLAAQGAGAHQEQVEARQLRLQLRAKDAHLPVVPGALQDAGSAAGQDS